MSKNDVPNDEVIASSMLDNALSVTGHLGKATADASKVASFSRETMNSGFWSAECTQAIKHATSIINDLDAAIRLALSEQLREMNQDGQHWTERES